VIGCWVDRSAVSVDRVGVNGWIVFWMWLFDNNVLQINATKLKKQNQ